MTTLLELGHSPNRKTSPYRPYACLDNEHGFQTHDASVSLHRIARSCSCGTVIKPRNPKIRGELTHFRSWGNPAAAISWHGTHASCHAAAANLYSLAGNLPHALLPWQLGHKSRHAGVAHINSGRWPAHMDAWPARLTMVQEKLLSPAIPGTV